MAPVNSDLEITSSVPAPKIYHAFVIDFDNLAPKVAPQGFKSIETLKGDGGVGTIKLVTFGEGIPLTSATHKVEGIDKENFTYSFSIIEGDLLMDTYESITYHLKIVPSDHGGSIIKQRTVYNLKGDAAEVPEEHINFGKEQFTGVFKAIEGYVLANPHAY